jgi:hypothetical protein
MITTTQYFTELKCVYHIGTQQSRLDSVAQPAMHLIVTAMPNHCHASAKVVKTHWFLLT